MRAIVAFVTIAALASCTGQDNHASMKQMTPPASIEIVFSVPPLNMDSEAMLSEAQNLARSKGYTVIETMHPKRDFTLRIFYYDNTQTPLNPGYSTDDFSESLSKDISWIGSRSSNAPRGADLFPTLTAFTFLEIVGQGVLQGSHRAAKGDRYYDVELTDESTGLTKLKSRKVSCDSAENECAEETRSNIMSDIIFFIDGSK